MEYPPGAIRAIEEVKKLCKRAKNGERIKIWGICIGDPPCPSMWNQQLYPQSGIIGSRLHYFGLDVRNFLHLPGYNVGGIATGWPDDFLFENYFLAYGYFLRCKMRSEQAA